RGHKETGGRDPISEQFNYLSAKSVSEEMLNSTIAEMERLTTPDQQQPASSSETSSSVSSLEIVDPSDLSRPLSAPPDQPEEEEEMMTSLISPEELGANDAFMLFLCLTMLLQNRDRIIGSRMDRNDIQMFFDGLVRKHDVTSVVTDARHL